MKKIPISLQLWSVNDKYRPDYAGTIATIAEIGFAAVEVPLDFGSITQEEAAKIIADKGLAVSGIHTGMDSFLNEFDKVVETARLFKTRHVVCPWIAPETYATPASCAAFGEKLNAIGAKARAAGLVFSFHNHAPDCGKVEGRCGLEWALDAAEPRNVSVEPDVYWIQQAGSCPAEFIYRVGARARLIHLKDGANGRQTEIGKGNVDMAAIFQAVESIGVAEWYVVEQEEFDGDSLVAIRGCFEQMKKWGKC